jgi:hypothetical protein
MPILPNVFPVGTSSALSLSPFGHCTPSDVPFVVKNLLWGSMVLYLAASASMIRKKNPGLGNINDQPHSSSYTKVHERYGIGFNFFVRQLPKCNTERIVKFPDRFQVTRHPDPEVQ